MTTMTSSFALIPVIDLMGGLVVHARAGERERYQPLSSSLARAPAPEAVVEGLLALHPFRGLYIADLDAIRKVGSHASTVASLCRRFPELDIWVDAGFETLAEARTFLDQTSATLVLGSESQDDESVLEALQDEERLVLSLDFKGDAPLGPAAIHDRPDSWPGRVIVMTLAAIGGTGGPDLSRLRSVADIAGPRRLFAAGGVRDARDLTRLARAGHAGVLLASALHDGRLGRTELAAFL